MYYKTVSEKTLFNDFQKHSRNFQHTTEIPRLYFSEKSNKIFCVKNFALIYSLELRLKKVPTKNTEASSIFYFIFMAIDSCDDNRQRNKGTIKIRLNVRSPEGDVSDRPSPNKVVTSRRFPLYFT
jgi:hypothetical protein